MDSPGVHVFSKDFYNYYRSSFPADGHICTDMLDDLAMQSNFGFYNITQLIFMYEIHCY